MGLDMRRGPDVLFFNLVQFRSVVFPCGGAGSRFDRKSGYAAASSREIASSGEASWHIRAACSGHAETCGRTRLPENGNGRRICVRRHPCRHELFEVDRDAFDTWGDMFPEDGERRLICGWTCRPASAAWNCSEGETGRHAVRHVPETHRVQFDHVRLFPGEG